jgi:hypothetical protein
MKKAIKWLKRRFSRHLPHCHYGMFKRGMFHVEHLFAPVFSYCLPMCIFAFNLLGMAILLWALTCWLPAFAADQLCLQTKTTAYLTNVVVALRQPSTNARPLGLQLIYRGAAFLTPQPGERHWDFFFNHNPQIGVLDMMYEGEFYDDEPLIRLSFLCQADFDVRVVTDGMATVINYADVYRPIADICTLNDDVPCLTARIPDAPSVLRRYPNPVGDRATFEIPATPRYRFSTPQVASLPKE